MLVYGIWGFPKIWRTFLGVPIIRIIVFGGLYYGLLIFGNYHMPLGPKYTQHTYIEPAMQGLDLGSCR